MNCRVTERLFYTFDLIQEEMRQPRDYGSGSLLTHSEVTFLDVVYQDPDVNASKISTRLGLTKGAITQTYQKLYQKGLIEQYKRSHNKKEKYFRLTELGKVARDGHQQFHEQANQRLCGYFSSLNEGEAQTILGFLEHLKQCMPFCQFPCKCGSEESKEVNYGSNPTEGMRTACCPGKQ